MIMVYKYFTNHDVLQPTMRCVLLAPQRKAETHL